MVFRARCCNPIRGEKIVGYITRGKGVSVHSATCPNVVNLLYDPERRIDVEWDKGVDASPYTVRLKISVEDRRGILADVSSRIADINTNIRDVEATVGADSARVDPHDRRDQRRETPRKSHEVDQEHRRRAGGRTLGTVTVRRSRRDPPTSYGRDKRSKYGVKSTRSTE